MKRGILDQWAQSALIPVELPSGLKALVVLPDVSTLVRTGKMPQELTDVAMKFAMSGIDVSKLQGSEIVEFIRLTYVLIADSLEYMAPAESAAWDKFRESGDSPTKEGWEAVSLTGAELAEMRVNQADLEALGAIAGRTKTPNEVTAQSRYDRGLLTREGALEAIEGSAGARVGDFAGFRREPGSADDRTDGEDVRAAAVIAPSANRAGRRARARSGDRS